MSTFDIYCNLIFDTEMNTLIKDSSFIGTSNYQLAEWFYLKQTHGCSADTSALETQIDQLVYKLYGLSNEEIEIIEGGGL